MAGLQVRSTAAPDVAARSFSEREGLPPIQVTALHEDADGTIWVQRVEDPRPFGVIKLNEQNEITDFVEKPEHFVSDLAIIGIY